MDYRNTPRPADGIIPRHDSGMLYPIFKKHNEVLAFGSVLFGEYLNNIPNSRGDQFASVVDC